MSSTLYHLSMEQTWSSLVNYLILPHPSGQFGVEFSCLEEDEEAARFATAAADLVIYTDGCCIQGKVGAAFCVMRDAAQLHGKKLKLSNFCTVYQAELLALSEATGYAASGSAQLCGILSDSRSALQTVANSDTVHPLAVRVKENVMKARENGKNVSFYWVKAYAGTERNERADQLAKNAVLKSKRQPEYEECPISFFKRQLGLGTLDEWNRRYIQCTTASTTRKFFPDAISAYRVLRNVEVDAVLVQLFTGHGGFSEYLHRYLHKEDLSCFCGPGVDQTVVHLVAHCPAFHNSVWTSNAG
ncbi:uncharacterized protein [Battus philenor]|uniref:uncharacterized protein n=1 Tax=Battus philenor TaxID=42288 RepID=UPI0035CF8143